MSKIEIDPRALAFFEIANSLAEEHSKGWLGRPNLVKKIRLRSGIITAMIRACDMAQCISPTPSEDQKRDAP